MKIPTDVSITMKRALRDYRAQNKRYAIDPLMRSFRREVKLIDNALKWLEEQDADSKTD